MTPVGAGENRTASAQLETAPTKHRERKCLFIFAHVKFSAKKPSFAEKTRFLFVLCPFFLYEPILNFSGI